MDVIYISPNGTFRVVHDSATGYYYPQRLENSLLCASLKAWHYVYSNEDRASCATPGRAREFEQYERTF